MFKVCPVKLLHKKGILILALVAGVFTWTLGEAQSDSAIQLFPKDLNWQESSNGIHGFQTIILAGNPNTPEPYAERIKIPAHSKIPPHSHPNLARMVTVLSGTFYLAFGDKFDETQLKTFPPGSFFTEPVNMRHYAMTKEEEVVLQLNAIGPASVEYVKEKVE